MQHRFKMWPLAHLVSLDTGSMRPMSADPEHLADAGFLAGVPRQCIAQASKTLPDPACTVEDEIRVEIDAPGAGRVRLTFRRRRYSRPRGNISYFSWLCQHAERIAPSAAVLSGRQPASAPDRPCGRQPP